MPKKAPEKIGSVLRVPLSQLHPHPQNPFAVRDDSAMQELKESVSQNGVLVPAIARPRAEGGYELIAGHRRKYACEQAGQDSMPVIVLNLNDDEAVIQLVDSNIQREDILPSERARAYKMKMDAIKRQGARTDLTSPNISAKFRSDDSVGEKDGISGDTVRNYISLNNLTPPLMQMVDEKKIALTPAYQLAALSTQEQELLVETMSSEQATPSLSQAQRMKKLSQSGELNEDTIVFCGCCNHALSYVANKRPYFHCRRSQAHETGPCHDLKIDAEELEQVIFQTIKAQLEAVLSIGADGSICLDAVATEPTEYEKQIEALEDNKQSLFEQYVMGEIDVETYKSEKAACDAAILKTKNAYAAIAAQAKKKQEEQARQSSRTEIAKAITDAETLTQELVNLLIEKVHVFPDKRIEIAYKVQDLFE